MAKPYQFKTTPFAHQKEVFQASRAAEYFALLMEQGTGKTKVTIDTAAWLYQQGRIDGLCILAPNGVHRVWIEDEIPAHLPEHVPVQTFLWRAQRAGTKKAKAAARAVLKADALAVFAFNIDTVSSKRGRAAIALVLKHRRCLLVVDESTKVKNPTAKRAKYLIGFKAGRHKIVGFAEMAPYRRILTGTPVVQDPFDLYAQFKVLSADYWKDLGSFQGFKTHYGIWEKEYNGKTGRDYPVLVEYKNMDELQARIAKHSFRVTKEQCLDLPPKLYQKRYFSLSADQRSYYDDLREEYVLELDSGEELTAPLAIVRLVRLQQIASGFLPMGEDADPWHIGEKEPRLDALAEVLEAAPGKAIVWCRFTHDIDMVMERFGDCAVRYDGSTKSNARAAAIKAFQKSTDCRLFVANPAAAGMGLTLHAATTVVYYSNSFNLEHRLQSEDRAHRIGQQHAVTYVDLIAEDTVDERLVAALRDKRAIADMLTGDGYREWL